MATTYRGVAGELKAAGAHYRDAEVVVDGNLVTSRTPADLPAFMRELLKTLQARAPARPAAWRRPGRATRRFGFPRHRLQRKARRKNS
jgi:hypothetical protein